jgi:hypothetical protein
MSRKRLRVIDHQAAAGRQIDLVCVRGFDLTLDLIAREQGHRILIELQFALRIRWHEALHVFLSLLEGLRIVDQAFADVVREVVAQTARDRIALLENQEWRGSPVIGRDDGVPGDFEIVQVPLQLLGAAADTRRTHDGPHAVGDDQPVHRVAHLFAVLALDAPRNATGARVVRHQDQEAAGETDERGERRALVAAFLFFHLDDQFLPLSQQVLDVHPALRWILRLEIVFRDFFQRQETVALRAVIDEGRFQAGLYAGYATLVDVGFLLFPGGNLNR